MRSIGPLPASFEVAAERRPRAFRFKDVLPERHGVCYSHCTYHHHPCTPLLPTIMTTTENEDEWIHIAITCMCSSASSSCAVQCTLTCYVADIKSLHLPEILKPGFRRTPRRLYAVVSIEDRLNIPYVMSSLDPEAYATRPMTL